MRSWTPRNPSPALRARLFAAAPEPRGVEPVALTWLAPASALAVAAFVTFTPRPDPLSLASGGARPMMAMTLSNQSMAAYLPGSFRGQRNHLSADRLAERFGWTKPVASPSSTPSLTRSRTNDAMR